MTAQQFDRAEVRALEGCTYCPRLCHFVCPAAHGEGAETATGWGMMTLANLIRRGDLTATTDERDALHRCTGCMRCTAVCVHSTPVADVLSHARGLLATSLGVPEAVDAATSELRPVEQPAAAGVVLFFGCGERLDSERRDAVTAFVSRAIGRPVAAIGGLGDDGRAACCGGTARRSAAANTDELESAFARAVESATIVLSTCPRAGAALPSELRHKVRPLLVALGDHADEIATFAAPSPAASPVTLHGGCDSRRPVDLAEAERRFLGALGLHAVDAFAAAGEQECCAAALPYSAVAPAGAARAAAAVVAGASLDARPLVTSSTRCAEHMRAASGDASIRSILELVLDRWPPIR
ncbi:MAG: (Fe-S)-binding protein [Myxococcales bacterium]|nr:(Fe-S)-binding protein [Myxococcales bacterium]MCB9531118.1 (Fe-S)-binding protein [Myxococcales bacterium]